MKLRELLQIIQTLQQNIGTSKAYICGGVPRDQYLNRLSNISDIDLTTGDKTIKVLFKKIEEELKKRFNIISKTMNDGHSSIFMSNIKLDFSSNFVINGIDKLLSANGVIPTNIKQEMFSRDFTCNSLLLSMDLKEIIDVTKRGLKDLNNKVIKTCLSPEITLLSNKNRVIRSIYLASKLDFSIDPSIVDFVSKNPESVKIASEKTLSGKINESFKWDADKTSYYLSKMNLWDFIPITEAASPYYNNYLKGKIRG